MDTLLNPTVIDHLKGILSVARNIEHRCGGISKTSQPLASTLPTFSVTLPPPNDITDDLLDMGLTLPSAQRLSEAFKLKILSFKDAIDDKIRKYVSSVRLAQYPPSLESQQRVAGVFENLYTRLLCQCTTQTFSMVNARKQGKWKQAHRRPFNQEFTPHLERYFEENAFPSHGEKVEMAKKSMMNFRQIDVWFQNRRSRAKKDGKLLKRSLVHEEPKTSFQGPDGRVVDRTILEKEKTNSVDLDTSEYEWQYDADEDDNSAWTQEITQDNNIPDIFNVKSPPHAFPSAFPPSCTYDPFPRHDGKCTLPSPVWMRHPAKSIDSRPVVNFDEFIADFSRLNIWEGGRKRQIDEDVGKPESSKRARTSLSKPDRSLFISTRTLPAPSPMSVIHSSLSVRSDPSSSASFQHASSLQLGTVTSTPPANPNKHASKKRKIGPLPRRSPADTSGIHRGVHTPDAPTTPSSRTLSSASRSSSFGSDYSSQTSTCSDSSSTSSVIATPENSPVLLPDHLKSFSLPSSGCHSIRVVDVYHNSDVYHDSQSEIPVAGRRIPV